MKLFVLCIGTIPFVIDACIHSINATEREIYASILPTLVVSCISILEKIKCKKIMIYHNITPAHFFSEYNNFISEICAAGRKELYDIREIFDYCLADSEHNKS